MNQPQYMPPPKLRLSNWRLAVFFAVLPLIALTVVVLGLWRLSGFMPELQNDLQNTYDDYRVMSAHRGTIVDKNGALLAMNTNVYHAAVHPPVLRRIYTAAEIPPLAAGVGAILGIDKETVLKKFRRKSDFVYLKKNMSPEEKGKLQELDIKGLALFFEYKSKRFYPNREVAAPLVGYTNPVGGQGIDFARHRKLQPTEGEIRGLRASDGRILEEFDLTLPKNGDRLWLTIDLRLQISAYEALRKALVRHKARAASAVVMDAITGDVLALANAPGFNPNNIQKSDLNSDEERTKNRVIADVVECGSTVKPFVLALALEHGLSRESEILPTAKPVAVSKKLTVRDGHIRKNISVAEVLTRSSNVGAYLLAKRVGKKRYHNFLRDVGFGGGQVLGLSDEATGVLRHHQDWRREDFATHAYGYGFSTTLIQLLRAYSIFSSDGLLVEPRLVSRRQTVVRRKISAQTAKRIRRVMQGVTKGTAPKASVFGYQVAGKTGTAYKFVNGQYDTSRRRTFFVGMAPAEKPRYLIAVMVDEPTKNGNSGGQTAAPIFSEIMRRALLFGAVPPVC
ncbi:MAG: penicillin-binding protein 2 [Candidatus Zeuxoniibacter abyssi]|nr:MAG: penicillin-binding protein 2 [Candidatus Persebacteraceae bacterium AB1(2)]